MQLRAILLATLGTLWLGATPMHAATTDQQKFENKNWTLLSR